MNQAPKQVSPAPRPRIAIIGDRGIPARYSGFSTLVEHLALGLVHDHAMDVTVYCRNNYYQDRTPIFRDVHRVFLPAPGGKSFESIVHSNLAILHAAAKGFDLAIVADPGNAPFGIPLLLRRTPTIYLTDGLGWKRRKWGPLQQRYYRWSEAVCAKIASWLVTDSRAMQDYYMASHGAQSSFIPYSGDVGDPPDDSALTQYRLQTRGYYLVVARMEPENNVDLIIREYRASGVSRPLVVVGSNPFGTEYSRQIAAEADERVICVGGIFESAMLNGLYAHCYGYLHGHEVGGTNPSLLRAMHGGAACIPIDVVFHREVTGDNALYFSKAPGNLASLLIAADAMPEEMRRLGSAARERVTALYRWDAVVAAYAELIHTMLRARQPDGASSCLAGREFYRPGEFAVADSVRP